MERSSARRTPEPSTAWAGWNLEHTYAGLPELFHVRVDPTPVRAPRMVLFNRPLAQTLGLDADALEGSEGVEILAGNRLPPGAAPLAQAYAGHQYGHFTKLGDGRAILLGEQITPQGQRLDVQLKGPGQTPFSRRGDGRAALGPMLREYIVSEAMHALGIPTTRSLAVVATGEEVFRQTVAPGAVLTRVAASHIRVGTFEWAAATGDTAAMRALVEYSILRHFPQLAGAPNAPLALLSAVVERQAELIARWMLVGFVHGVMNTDNMAVSGETIDYGPCAFMEAFDPATVFSSIDTHGRYAYGNQPPIAAWNLTRFAETLVPVIDDDEQKAVTAATEAVKGFADSFQQHWYAGLRRKLGLFTEEAEDIGLIQRLLAWMQANQADFTNTFAELVVHLPPDRAAQLDDTYRAWHGLWVARLHRQPQGVAESEQLRHTSNPAFIPRNHVVEAALAAAEQGDLQPIQALLEVLATPFNHRRDAPEYRCPASAEVAAGYQTYCGT